MAGIKSGTTFDANTDEISVSRSGDLGTATFASVQKAMVTPYIYPESEPDEILVGPSGAYRLEKFI